MMRGKIYTGILSAFLLLSLVGCGDDGEVSSESDNGNDNANSEE